MGICKNNRNKKEKNQCNNNFCHKIRSYDVPNRILTIILLQMAESPYYHSINKR